MREKSSNGKIYWEIEMVKVVGIIQARTGSTRLPNKVVRKLGDKTILEVLLNRLIKSKTMNEVVIATTTKKEDDVIQEIASRNGFKVFRGSEEDVLDRYYKAAKEYCAEVIVRVTADNPLTDVDLIDSQVKCLLLGGYDYVSTKGVILGLGSEVFTFDALEKAWENAREKYQREHVTPYIYEHPNCFKILLLDPPSHLRRSDIRLTIDVTEDCILYEKLFKEFGDLVYVDIKDVISFLDQHPSIKSLNAHVKQKNYWEV